MKKTLLAISLALFVVLPVRAEAGAAVKTEGSDRLTVIELFTSQGCSSCPPADAILKTLRDRPGLLTLSWAVDYWDRLGWEDTFADPYNSMRQTAYNKRFGRGGVFTPQMVFDGRLQSVGSDANDVRASIEKAKATPRPNLNPKLVRGVDTITVSLDERPDMKMVAVRVVWYLGDAMVKIGDGENQGRMLHYTNIVLGSSIIEDWDGKAKSYQLNISDGLALGADHMAILLQDKYGHGPILGAAFTVLGGAQAKN